MVAELVDESTVAVDTEFHAERRYAPELMLVQVADIHGRTWVVDPLAVSLSPLAPAFANKTIVVHSGSQDLWLLHRDCEVSPPSAFDVQIAAGMAGLGHPTRLDTLVAALLKRPLNKGATLSDWSKRPLTSVQINYAAADVQVLFAMKAVLEDALNQSSRLHWAQEESELMRTKALGPKAVDHHWTRWEIAPRLDETTQRVLGTLFEWRDRQGRNKNQPGRFMLSDGLCLDIARRKPITLTALAENRRIPQGLMRKLGPEIVKAVSWALDTPMPMPPIPTIADQQRIKPLLLWAEAMGANMGVASNLLMPDPLALQVVSLGVSALAGWRQEAIAEALSEFLSGKTGVFMTEKGACVR
jgi:ribonuclease D